MGTMMGFAPPVLDPNKFPTGALGEPQAAPGALKAAAPLSAAKGAFGAAPAPAAPPPAAAKPAAKPVANQALGADFDFGSDLTDLPAPRVPTPAKKPADAPQLPQVDDLSMSNIRLDQLPMPKREVDLPRPNASVTPPPHIAAQIDEDLPALKPQGFADLPAVKPQGFADLPAVKPQGFTDLPGVKPQGFADLPGVKPQGFTDLPGVKPQGFTDLPGVKPQALADLPALRTEVDLPAPKGPALAFGDLDLPTPKQNVDLPAPKGTAELPALKGQVDLPKRAGGVRFGEIDLPTPKAGGVDLPTPKAGGVDLPTPKGMVDLPAPRNDLPVLRGGDDSSFADISLDMPDLGSDEETAPDDGFGDIELPPPKPAADMVASRERTMQGQARRAPTGMVKAAPAMDTNGPDSELPPSLLGGDESSFDDLNLDDVLGLSAPPPSSKGTGGGARAARPSKQQSSLPPSLGDSELDSSQDELLSDDLVDEEEEYEEGDDFGEEEFSGEEEGEGGEEQEMEFGMSGDDADRASLAPEALRRQRGEDFEARQAASRKRTVTIVVRLAAFLVLLTAGAATLAFTEYGIFGVYYWEQWLPEAGDPEFARAAILKAEKIAAADTYTEVQRSLKELGAARSKAGINRTLLSRGLLHESLYVVRFGDDPGASSRAAAILKRLEERSGKAPEMDLARAAYAARRKAYPDAMKSLALARKQGPRDPYVELLAGEVALVQSKLDDAERSFAQALKLGGAARAQWGLARVAIARGDKEAQASAVNETLKLSPMHVDARIAEAQIVWAQGKEDRGVHLLQVALGREPTEEDRYLWSSKSSMAAGFSVLGYIHETRGRSHLARDAYDQALKADAYRVEALLGSARVLLREKRPNDALPRFESALNSATKGGVNPIVLSGRRADMEAKLGIGRVLLGLDRTPEAKAKLIELAKALPNDAEVSLALGEAEEKLGHGEKAEAELRKSISLAPSRFDGYLSLSQLFFRQGNAAKASEVLNEAAGHVEETAHMRRMLGQSELARNRLESAAHEFKRALELDPYDIEAQFGLGISLRKGGDLAEAERALESIAKRDPNFGGLAEQRGLLLEARGEYGKAVTTYQSALEKDPTDMSLVLRLGAAQVLAGSFDDAEQTLAKVLREMPNSAEAEYFIGRVAFGRGRTPDALAHFDRAISLDITRAEYHLYVARATYDMGNFGRTLEEVEVAIARDPNLGDAYWVRAMVRLRMGAVRDSLKDIDKALRMNPARVEAYAVRGDCYEQLRQLPEAITAYRTALERDPARALWWYRLSGLLADSGSPGEADAALKHALELGEKADPMPYWLPDAYRMGGELAERGNNRQAAIRHYKRYREVAQTSAIDYPTVLRKLKDWGVELDEDQ